MEFVSAYFILFFWEKESWYNAITNWFDIISVRVSSVPSKQEKCLKNCTEISFDWFSHNGAQNVSNSYMYLYFLSKFWTELIEICSIYLKMRGADIHGRKGRMMKNNEQDVWKLF